MLLYIAGAEEIIPHNRQQPRKNEKQPTRQNEVKMNNSL